jgi:hypothetical protein
LNRFLADGLLVSSASSSAIVIYLIYSTNHWAFPPPRCVRPHGSQDWLLVNLNWYIELSFPGHEFRISLQPTQPEQRVT